MSTSDAVKGARSPQEAMLRIAEALDRIEETLAQQPADAWTQEWQQRDYDDQVKRQEARSYIHDPNIPGADVYHIPLDESGLDDLDPAQRAEALAARLRLSKDKPGQFRDDPLAQEYVPEAESADVDLREVSLEPVSEEVQARRRSFVEQVLHLDERFNQEGLDDAYVKGGPLWLYLASADGRKFILGLPVGLRQRMVRDIEEQSVTAASEFARDVLMARTTEETAGMQQLAQDVVLGG